MLNLDNRLPPPIVFSTLASAMWFCSRSDGTPRAKTLSQLSLTAALILLAAAFSVPAFMAFRRAKTTINPIEIESASSLVTCGPYQWSRNPMYVGLASLLLALSVYLGTLCTFLGPFLFVLWITQFQIIPEERVMRAKFGKAYEEYSKSVRRWI